MGSYIPVTEPEHQKMLDALGMKNDGELYRDVPDEVLVKGPLNLPAGKSELEVRRFMEALAGENKVFSTILRGAGAYHHYIPSMVRYIPAKEEFLTSYTPYQAEVSQGVLQSIFEFQTMICELTAMDASNASVYDGASAAAEAVAMCRDRKRQKAVIAATSHPDTIATVQTYCHGMGSPVVIAPEKAGLVDMAALETALDEETACLYIQYPNFYGFIENMEALIAKAHEKGAKVIVGCNPLAMALLKPPGELGADIAVGEGQPLGMPLAYGGPYLGFMATRDAMARKLPGRIVGETTDVRGQRAFVLTLQAREQHIRREKASSNICSNQALCAMTASVYMTVMGPEGLREAARQSMSKARYLAEGLCGLPDISLWGGENGATPFFHEFVTTCGGKQQAILDALAAAGILGGLPLSGDRILWCCTEMVSKDEMDKTISLVREVLEK